VLKVVEAAEQSSNTSVRERAINVLRRASAGPNDPILADLVSLLIWALSHPNRHRREAATDGLRAVLAEGADLTMALKPVALTLEDSSNPVARGAAWVLENCAGAGYDMNSVREALVNNSSNPCMSIRTSVSRAMSAYMLSTGQEEPLPQDCGHRRLYAADDKPIAKDSVGDRCACGVCGSSDTRCIFTHGCGSLAGTHQWWEWLCLDCGKYTITEMS
jgi:hypothetical protein